jgi:hypothetical protein
LSAIQADQEISVWIQKFIKTRLPQINRWITVRSPSKYNRLMTLVTVLETLEILQEQERISKDLTARLLDNDFWVQLKMCKTSSREIGKK